jgi:hypothetical protein
MLDMLVGTSTLQCHQRLLSHLYLQEFILSTMTHIFAHSCWCQNRQACYLYSSVRLG